jgi:F-type H+-transporting ATPase subunit gamma
MEHLPRLKARIASLHELRDLMGAMRVLAASHVQEAQGALNGIRQYVDIVEDGIAEGAALLPMADAGRPAPQQAVEDVLVVVCSEHGFVGGFNEQLLDRAVTELKPRQKLVVIGRRGGALAEERSLAVEWCEPMATHIGGVPGVARRIAGRLAGTLRVEVVFASYRRGGQFDIERRRILPLDPALLERTNGNSRPLHHLPADVLLRQLASEYLLAEITRSVMESFASANGARLRIMEAADRTIDEKLDRLGRRAQTLRQEAITTELLDLVTGVEAILGPSA